MGLPQINIVFQTKAATLIERSQKGIVALLVKDDTYTAKNEVVYTSIDQVTEAWAADTKKLIELCFKGTPKKIYVFRYGSSSPTIDETLKLAGNRKWNWMAFPTDNGDEMDTVATWIKTKRNTDKKTYKLVAASNTADDMGIVNFTSDEIKVGADTFSNYQYSARIAGTLAGMPIDRAATYYSLPEVSGFKELADDDERNSAIDAGELILINDGEKVKIARGVNSLTTTTATVGAVFKKIRIVDTVDMVRDDLTETIKDQYIGKWVNTYQNKLLLIGAINAYLRTLAVQENVLDPEFDNKAEIDYEAQRTYLAGLGVDVDNMDEEEILRYNTNDQVFIKINMKPTDVMEDITINVYM